MANNVYANNREIACKKASGKAICAFPDVCFTPPQTPATPPGVPIPYPNTGMASDTTKGSKKTKISGAEIMLKNQSHFKTSSGDEAGCAPKKGLITSKNKGKIYFNAWSMDVKVEGKNAVRHLDLSTHNHASTPGQTPPWPYLDSMSAGNIAKCDDDREREQEACGHDEGSNTYTMSATECCESKACQKARKCMLVPYGRSGSPNCCEGLTGHHMIEDHWVANSANFNANQRNKNKAPTVCVEGGRSESEHGIMHAVQGIHEDSYMPGRLNHKKGRVWNYAAGKKAALRAHQATFPLLCSRDCLEAQLDAHYGLDTSPSRKLEQSKRLQGVGKAREYAETLVDVMFGGPGS